MPDESAEPSDDRPHSSPPLHAQFHFQPIAARVPEPVSPGQFANGAIVMTGPHEFLIDFVLRLHQPNSVVGRVILPHEVTRQFIRALESNIEQYEQMFGPVPPAPLPIKRNTPTTDTGPIEPGIVDNTADVPSASVTPVPRVASSRSQPIQIDEIYDGLKFPERHQPGCYANAVLIRHTNTEFCFDFVANFYPRPVVVHRFFFALGQVVPFYHSLKHSFDQRFGRPQPDPPADSS